MEYRQLGSAGVRVSVVGWGTNRFGSPDMPQAEVNRVIDAALDAGVNFLDSANVYNDGRSEETLGAALKGRMDKVVMATKFNFPRKTSANSWGASRYQMMQAVEQSLRRLQTDHIDLYYCHRWDDTTPIDETLRGLDDLIRMGKVNYIGESLRIVQELMVERNYQMVSKLADWAQAHERGVNELAQAWLLAQPSVCSVITGAKRVDHVTGNVKAADWHLTADELKEIEGILKGSKN